MKTYKLSPRLSVIAGFAEGRNTVADIGCDHGKISVYLARNGSNVHAVDISKPSLQKAKMLAKLENVQENINFYCDDGLNSITSVRLDAVIIAGMGWRMIGQILEANFDSVKDVDTLILQPMDSVIDMRQYLADNGYAIIDEELVWDDNRLYTVISAKYGVKQCLTLAEILLGPKIIEKNDEYILHLIAKEIKKRRNILEGLNRANTKDFEQIKKVKNEIDILNRESDLRR